MTATRALAVAAHLFGVVAFVGPLLMTNVDRVGEAAAHATDAPWLFTILGTMLIAVAVADLRAGRSDAKQIALLGVLVAINAVLRLPGSLGGASLMFVLPILAGYAFGARFGFLLGSLSFAASAAITGGVGPWLPFQMWALGWVGAGAGLLPRARLGGGTRAVAVLAVYGWLAGFAFGFVMNLWSWPFTVARSAIAWHPGLPLADVASRYVRFYLATSLAWDAGRAIANAVLIATLGKPVVRLLGRARERLTARWVEAGIPAGG